MTDAPSVRYARTPDGVAIAYTVHGSGSPLLLCRSWSHLEAEWQIAEMRSWLELLGTSFMVIRYDIQGSGMSDRVAVGLEQAAVDAVSVLDDIGVEEVDFFGFGLGHTPESVFTLYKLGERVRRALLWCPNSHGVPPVVRALQAVAEFDDDLYFDTIMLWHGWENPASRRAMIEMRQISGLKDQSPGLYEKLDERSSLALEVLPKIATPTLVMARRDWVVVPHSEVDAFARALRNGQRRNLSGRSAYPALDDQSEFMAAICDFLQPEPSGQPTSHPESFQTIMFTDLESSTALTQRVGDEAAQDVLHGHNDAVRKALEEHGGREVKHTGDGIMAAFPSAVRAVEAALQIQRDLAGGEVRVRIGLNAGEPIAEDDDFFGTAVQLAARICDRAEPGQVLVSRVVADLCAGKKLSFQHHSDATLKGFDDPVALFEVGG